MSGVISRKELEKGRLAKDGNSEGEGEPGGGITTIIRTKQPKFCLFFLVSFFFL